MLEIINVNKKYCSNDFYSNKDINFRVKKGEIFGLLGLNGAGKTTLLKSITGIHDFEGQIIINGFDIKKQPIEAKNSFGYIPDNHATFEELTGNEYINFMADIYKVSLKDRKERKARLVAIFQMEEHLNKMIKHYSHGMKQKIAIIAGIIHYPKLWILDEPLVGLDVISMQEIIKFMKEYVKIGNSIIFSSHIIPLIEELCDRAVLIKNGKNSMIYDFKDNKKANIQKLSQEFTDTEND